MVQIREHKMYKRRDGQRVGPAYRNEMPNKRYPWIINGWLYSDNGRSYTKTELDIVEEDYVPEVRGEVVSINNNVATIQLLDPAPKVTGTYRIVVNTPIGNVEGVICIGSDNEREGTDDAE